MASFTVNSGTDTVAKTVTNNDVGTIASGATPGKDEIIDFNHGDHIEFDGVFGSFAALQAAMHQVGSNTIISLGVDHTITLDHVTAATSLHASDFLLI
jgi:hypothetical protein